MKRVVPIFVVALLACQFSLLPLISKSQSISSNDGKIEAGVGLGPSFFLGDLGGNQGIGKGFVKDVNLPLTKIAFGAYVNLYPTEWLGFRLAFNRLHLEGADSLIADKGGDEYFRKLRNLSFRTNVLEAYVAAEIYPTVFFEQYDGLQGKLRPYGLIGIGAFKFNPQTQYTTTTGRKAWVDLQPLHTEGQGFAEYPDRKEYKLTQLEIPMGVGFKYYIKESMYVGLEVLHRKTFTDYVDDVSTNYIDENYFNQYLTPSQAQIAQQIHFREDEFLGTTGPLSRPGLDEQRGDPTENDAFFSTILRLGWRLNGSNPVGKQMRCPVFY